jgi:general secretion pathway protein G
MNRKAFTLVEILLVVVILGILAAVVIPTFASCTSAAKDSALAQDLAMIKRMMLVYKAQHLEAAPGYPDGDRSQAPTEEAFLAQTTTASDAHGATAAIGTVGYKYGPYMERIPANPYVDTALQRSILVLGDNEDFPAEPDNQHGWICKPATQEVRAGNTGADESGKRYYDY